MAKSDISPGKGKSYIEEKVISVSREIGIQTELFFETTFEEIEEKLGITDESISEFKNQKSRSPGKIKGSIFARFASPIFRKDITRKQKYIDKFISRRGMGK